MPKANPNSVYIFYGHGSNEMCITTGITSTAPLKHGLVASYDILTMPTNVIVVGVGNIGQPNYASLQEAFRRLAVDDASRDLLLDPEHNKDAIEERLEAELVEERKSFKSLPKPELFINVGRLFHTTFNFIGNPFSYDEASGVIPENVDKSGLYSLDALQKDKKSINQRLTGSNTFASYIPKPDQLKSLFYATDDYGFKIAGSEAIQPSQAYLDILIDHYSKTPQTLADWHDIFASVPVKIEQLFDLARKNPKQLFIYYLPACRSSYVEKSIPTRGAEKAIAAADIPAKQTNVALTKQVEAIARFRPIKPPTWGRLFRGRLFKRVVLKSQGPPAKAPAKKEGGSRKKKIRRVLTKKRRKSVDKK